MLQFSLLHPVQLSISLDGVSKQTVLGHIPVFDMSTGIVRGSNPTSPDLTNLDHTVIIPETPLTLSVPTPDFRGHIDRH